MIYAIDPGGTCGVAWRDLGGHVHSAEMDPVATLHTIENLPRDAEHELVIERFTIDGRTLRASRDGVNTTLYTIGALLWVAHKAGHGVTFQAPGDAKRVITDARLKAMGLYRPTKGGHANDGMRHLVMYLAKRGLCEVPT